MSKISKRKVIKLYDDRGKGEDCLANEVLFEDNNFILCKVKKEVILIDRSNGEVLTSNFQFYIAENI